MSIKDITKIYSRGRSFPFMIVLLFFMECQSGFHPKGPNGNSADQVTYDIKLEEPIILPNSLREISGIHNAGKLGLLAINDEKGKLYQLDTNDYSVIKKLDFASKGDYEALTGVQDTMYCLSSEGKIYKLLLQNDDLQVLNSGFIYGLPYGCETESLAIMDGQLFTICKKERFRKDYHVLSIHRSDGRYSAEFAFDWTRSLNRFMNGNGYPDYSVNPTDLVYNSETGHWVLLSSKPSALFLISGESNLIFATLLDENIWPQPEGITLANDSLDYILSSEGKKSGHIGKVSLLGK